MSSATKLDSFTDVWEIQRSLKAAGAPPFFEADDSTTGPARVMPMDADGNRILLDPRG